MTNLDRHWSTYYDSGKDFIYLSPSSLSKILEFTDKTLYKNALDLGCGTGQITRDLIHRGYIATGVDISISAIKIASQSAIFDNAKIKFLHLDIEQTDLPSINEGYSLVICKLVIAFIKNKESLYKRVDKILHKNGIFVIITPHIKDVLPEKANIAVDAQIFKKELQEFFKVESVYQDTAGWVYVCKKN